jgi:hypothetical protein
MKGIGLWIRRGFGLLALGLGAAGLVGLGSTLVEAIAAGASLIALLPMAGIALVFILPLLVLGRRGLLAAPALPTAEPQVARAAGRGWLGVALGLVLAVGLIVGGRYWFQSANRDLIELTRAREVDLPAVRPAVLKFRAEQGRFPAQLAELVPGYLPRLPESLVNREGMEPVLRLGYWADRDTARARFHRHRGPDSRADYDFVSGRLAHDE